MAHFRKVSEKNEIKIKVFLTNFVLIYTGKSLDTIALRSRCVNHIDGLRREGVEA